MKRALSDLGGRGACYEGRQGGRSDGPRITPTWFVRGLGGSGLWRIVEGISIHTCLDVAETLGPICGGPEGSPVPDPVSKVSTALTHLWGFEEFQPRSL